MMYFFIYVSLLYPHLDSGVLKPQLTKGYQRLNYLILGCYMDIALWLTNLDFIQSIPCESSPQPAHALYSD